MAGYPSASAIFYSMHSLTGVLVIPAVIALYLALKGINKNVMLVAAGIVALRAVIDPGGHRVQPADARLARPELQWRRRPWPAPRLDGSR